MTDGAGADSTELARLVGGDHHGPQRTADRLVAPERPEAGGVAVWPEPEAGRLAALAQAGVRVVVVDAGSVEAVAAAAAEAGLALIAVPDARLALARLSARFDRRPRPAAPGVHATALVHERARLGEDVRVGAFSVVGDGARLGAGSVIGNRCTVGAGTVLGDDCVVYDGVVLYDGVTLGRRVRVHANAVIGADGFGYALGPRGAEKIHHLGGVVVGDDVEIGALTAVDRGTLGDTRIGDRSKIDNFCQVAHNVTIGADVVIAGQTGLAGSCRIGDRVVIGGACSIADHVTVGDDARLAGRSGVSKDVPPGETWAGLPAQPHRRWIRERYLVNNLERIWAAVRGKEPRR